VYLSAPASPPRRVSEPDLEIMPVNPFKQLSLVEANKEKRKNGKNKRKAEEDPTTPDPKSVSLELPSPLEKPLRRCSKKARNNPAAPPSIPADDLGDTVASEPKPVAAWFDIPADIPQEAKPQGQRTGRLSYTLAAANGAKIEVLLKGKALRVSKTAVGMELPAKRQMAWSGGMEEAWKWAKENSGYVVSEDVN
jgi:hypothetical protein